MANYSVKTIDQTFFEGPFRFVGVEPKYKFSTDRGAPKVQELDKVTELPLWKVGVFTNAGVITVSVPLLTEPNFKPFDDLDFVGLAAGAYNGDFYWKARAAKVLNG